MGLLEYRQVDSAVEITQSLVQSTRMKENKLPDACVQRWDILACIHNICSLKQHHVVQVKSVEGPSQELM